MSEAVLDTGVEATGTKAVVRRLVADKQVFGVPWGKAMMWIFLLSDTFIFQLFPRRLHDGSHLDDRSVAEPERSVRSERVSASTCRCSSSPS